MYVAILAGGIGTRLWPRSRQGQPKQFSDITGSGKTMIQETVHRLSGLIADDRIYVITGERYADLTASQLPQIPLENILVEPSGRNTAPAIGLACAHLHHRDPDAVVAILSADQLINDRNSFQASLKRAFEAAADNWLVTLGIEPTLPHTGYGYIKEATPLLEPDSSGLPVYVVEKFLEKPNLETAKGFLRDGGYYWNGGMFVTRTANMFGEMARQMPEAHACLQEIVAALANDSYTNVLNDVWPRIPSVSIDYGIMEGAKRVAVVPLRAGWSDLGSWDALEGVLGQNQSANCVVNGEILPIESQGNIIYCDKTLVALIGVQDLVVVETPDTLLVGRKSEMQKVKQVVEDLQTKGRLELL